MQPVYLLNKNLLDLDISNDDVFYYVMGVYAHNTTLKALNISNNWIGSKGLSELSSNRSLEYLNISNLSLYDDSIPYISKINTLKHLIANGNCFTELGVSKLKNLKLLTLEIKNNHNRERCVV